jgi:hypothetical protein
MNDNLLEITVTVKQMIDALRSLGQEYENHKIFFVNVSSNTAIEETETYTIWTLSLGEYGEVVLTGQKTRSHLLLKSFEENMKKVFPLDPKNEH